jgi:hypothetical protein
MSTRTNTLTKELEMSAVRKVTATAPESTVVTARQSKTKVYSHALAVFYPAQGDVFGTGWHRNVDPADVPADAVVSEPERNDPSKMRWFGPGVLETAAYEDHWTVVSFHTSEALAYSAGRNHWSKPSLSQVQAVPVTVLDEGFNAG